MSPAFYKWCGEDRDALLAALRHFGRTYPAQAVAGVCQFLGYRVLTTRLQLGLKGTVDVRAHTITLNYRAYRRVRDSSPHHEAESLAHELGHIRLHEDQLRAGQVLGEQHEEEADAYARIFLVPRQVVLASYQVREIPRAERRERWNLVFRLATRMGVTPGLMAVRLRELGVPGLERQPRAIKRTRGIPG